MEPSEGSPARLRVLIAEDEALIRLDLSEMLREEGYDVCGMARDGQEAIELAESLRPDLIILDVKMPRLDGLTAAEVIGEQRIAPIVVLSAFSQRDLVDRALKAGVMTYLTKPFAQADLAPAIETAYARFAEMRALEAEIGDLNDRIETRKIIERAKSFLMTAHKLSEPAAFRWIQRSAMERRTTMKVVAEAILDHSSGR
ncbi:ANTAR domain-containing response regulator [Cumulibacter manganitolerans]|uniref:ANTAR domain-containing response regulator n=1 Tax=Cumulibacter manganitolerans TaxID=1884992 RepID=UPI00129531F6|nr:response regulator [Cumulibacter manganitolerans]